MEKGQSRVIFSLKAGSGESLPSVGEGALERVDFAIPRRISARN
jgi:hypothetical protein